LTTAPVAVELPAEAINRITDGAPMDADLIAAVFTAVHRAVKAQYPHGIQETPNGD
jgi:hypothetical protein